MPNYENPWETFSTYLENNNINPDQASGVQFYLYLLACLQVCLAIIPTNMISIYQYINISIYQYINPFILSLE